jgi:ribosome-associated heat shock protein Hsp15
MDKMRVDKWLWAARFFKTRSLAVEQLDKGHIRVNRVEAKPSRDVHVGDTVEIWQSGLQRTVVVQGLSLQRGPAPVAQALYAETPDSLAARERWAELRRLNQEPAQSIEHGRPTKRERRHLDKAQHHWDNRWSASVDDRH